MKKQLYIILTAAVFFTGCGDSFYQAQNYFTGPVDGVGLKSSTTIMSGGGEQLYAVVTPSKTENKNVTWTSSDPSIANVDSSGYVTVVSGVLHGETKQAVITVTTEEGNFNAKCTVIVVEKPVAVTGVSLNKGSTYLLTGNSETLYATVIPSNSTNQNLSWSSSNSLVASVNSSGTVLTESSTGSAVITVSTADGGFTASCVFTVSLTPVLVDSITVNKTGTIVQTGKSEKLFVSFSPLVATNQNIIWSSSDSGIAAVDNTGSVTGVSAGDAVITAKSVDGNKTASTAVTTVNFSVPVTGVNLNKAMTLITAGFQERLSAEILPAEATNRNLIWKSSDSSIASVDSSGRVTGVASGDASITVTTIDGDFSKSCLVRITPDSTYTVTYNPNGADSGTGPADSGNYLPGATVTVMNNGTLAKAGYTFSGWNTLPGGGGTGRASGSTFVMGSSNVVLYAAWSVSSVYSLSYDPNLGTGTPPAGSITYAPGTDVKVLSNTFSRASYTFLKWSLKANGAGGTYQADDYVTLFGPNMILYAIWNPIHPASVTVTSPSTGLYNVSIGGILQLGADVLPADSLDKSVTWSSGNDALATVSTAGVVTGVSKGQVTITVKTTDGNRTGSQLVNILSNEKAITSYNFTPSIPGAVVSINEGAKTITVSSVPFATDVSALKAVFTLSAGAALSIGGVQQYSGITANDFRSSKIYTVTAEDGTTTAYTVTLVGWNQLAFSQIYSTAIGYWRSIDISDDGSRIVSCDTGTGKPIVLTSNSGVTWASSMSLGYWDVVSMSGTGQRLLSVRQETFYTSVDSGASWQEQSVGGSVYVYRVGAISSSGVNFVASRQYGNIYTMTASGSWTSSSSGFLNWNDVKVCDNGFIAGTVYSSNVVYTSSDFGVSFNSRTVPGAGSIESLALNSDGSKIVVCSFGGYTYTSVNSGINWIERTSFSGSYKVASSANGMRIAVIAGVYPDYKIYVSLDGGVHWGEQTSAGVRKWVAIAWNSAGTILVAAENGGYIYRGVP